MNEIFGSLVATCKKCGGTVQVLPKDAGLIAGFVNAHVKCESAISVEMTVFPGTSDRATLKWLKFWRGENEISMAARYLVAKKIGFGEFKRIVRENS